MHDWKEVQRSFYDVVRRRPYVEEYIEGQITRITYKCTKYMKHKQVGLRGEVEGDSKC